MSLLHFGEDWGVFIHFKTSGVNPGIKPCGVKFLYRWEARKRWRTYRCVCSGSDMWPMGKYHEPTGWYIPSILQ